MEQINKYDIVSVACRARLVFRTEREYREALGVSFDTLVAKRGSANEMEIYYGILDRKASELSETNLADFVERYEAASRFYRALDWGDRTQMASRRRFCRMLFRLFATAGKELTSDEVLKFKVKDADSRLMQAFFPDGPGGTPSVDIGLVTLFAFGVLRPWDSDRSRGHDISDNTTIRSIGRLRSLIELLRTDIPRLGSTYAPLVFSEWLGGLDMLLSGTEDISPCTPVWLACSMDEIATACRALVISECQRVEGAVFQGLYMGGIWIDDADNGQTRFWVFPDNITGAFCYRRNGIGWKLDAYDFRVRPSDVPDRRDSFSLVAPEANRRYTLSPDYVIEDDQMASGTYDEKSDTGGESTGISFYEGPRKLPAWFNWRRWERLPGDSVMYQEFRSVLTDIYSPASPQSRLFLNSAPEITDVVNNLTAIDHRYIYIYDWQPERFRMRETSPQRFYYEGVPRENMSQRALFDLDISPRHPLYAFPITMRRSKHGHGPFDRLAEILSEGGNIVNVSIIHPSLGPFAVAMFPDYGYTVQLDMDSLTPLGVKKFTSRLV